MAGRKLYKPTKAHIDTVRALKEKGATDQKCAEAIGVSYATFKNRKKSFFSQAIKKGQEDRARSIYEGLEDKMQQAAHGYTATDTEYEWGFDEQSGKMDWLPTKKKERHIPPNTTMQMFLAVNLSDGKYNSINRADDRSSNTPPPKIEVEIVSSEGAEAGKNT